MITNEEVKSSQQPYSDVGVIFLKRQHAGGAHTCNISQTQTDCH